MKKATKIQVVNGCVAWVVDESGDRVISFHVADAIFKEAERLGYDCSLVEIQQMEK